MNAMPKNAPPSAHMRAILTQLWSWFRVILCAVAVPVAAVWLYACFYL